MNVLAGLLLGFAVLAQPPRSTVRIKELAGVAGVRDNQLIGYGLVVGLAGTGDKKQTVFSAQSLSNLLQRMGVLVSPTAFQVSNTAAVLVTATLPPYAQPGTRLDITVAAIGDAKTLQGGLLVLTPLKAADGQVYAVSQGPILTGGFSAGGGGTTQTLNHPTAGRVPGGAIIERTGPTPKPSASVNLQLRRADFTTAARIAEAINQRFSDAKTPVASAENSALVSVHAPASYESRPVEFLSELENLMVESDRVAKIIINERTGTITMGKDVRIAGASVLHGNLTVEVQTTFEVSQPAPLSSGQTTVTPATTVAVKEDKARNVSLRNGTTVDELVRALLAIGSTPRDIIAILQSLRAAGAIEAEIEVI